MAAYRYAARRQKADGLDHGFTAFDLDHLRAGRHQLRRIPERIRGTSLECAERHVGDDPRAFGTARNTGRVINNVGERDRQGRVMALQHHAERIADQQRIHARGVEHRGKTRVVAGQHRDLLAVLRHLVQGGLVNPHVGSFQLRKSQIRNGQWVMRDGKAYSILTHHLSLIANHSPRLKNSRAPRIAAMRSSNKSKSAGASTKLRCSEFTINTGAASY